MTPVLRYFKNEYHKKNKNRYSLWTGIPPRTRGVSKVLNMVIFLTQTLGFKRLLLTPWSCVEKYFMMDGCTLLDFKISTTIHCHYIACKSQNLYIYIYIYIYIYTYLRLYSPERRKSYTPTMAYRWVNHGIINIFATPISWVWLFVTFMIRSRSFGSHSEMSSSCLKITGHSSWESQVLNCLN